MTGFIKLPYPGKERPTVINISQIKSFWVDVATSGPYAVRFTIRDNIIEAVFETKQEAEEFYDKICNYLLIEV